MCEVYFRLPASACFSHACWGSRMLLVSPSACSHDRDLPHTKKLKADFWIFVWRVWHALQLLESIWHGYSSFLESVPPTTAFQKLPFGDNGIDFLPICFHIFHINNRPYPLTNTPLITTPTFLPHKGYHICTQPPATGHNIVTVKFPLWPCDPLENSSVTCDHLRDFHYNS